MSLKASRFSARFPDLLKIFGQSELPSWIAALLVGFLAVGYARIFAWSESHASALLSSHPYWFLVFAPLVFVLSWALVHFLAPEARGSGIPQVMAAIEHIEKGRGQAEVGRFLSLRTSVVKVASSVACVLGGGAVGREGPTVQIAASVFHFSSRKLKTLSRKQLSTELWLVTGGAAGIAAAFNTPLGGLVYAIEELATSHFRHFRTTLISAVIISGLAAQWVSGSYLYLGFPKIPAFSIAILPWVVLFSAFCGLGGAAFGRALYLSSSWAKKRRRVSTRALIALLCGLALALLAVFVDHRTAGSGREAIEYLLFSADKEQTGRLALMRLLGPIVSYMAGTAGGVFAPSLAGGAALGYWIADLVRLPESNLFVLLGMIAFLTGVTRTPFTAFVLVLEMTDRHSAIFPMMLSAVVASQVSRWIQAESIYEVIKRGYCQARGEGPADAAVP